MVFTTCACTFSISQKINHCIISACVLFPFSLVYFLSCWLCLVVDHCPFDLNGDMHNICSDFLFGRTYPLLLFTAEVYY